MKNTHNHIFQSLNDKISCNIINDEDGNIINLDEEIHNNYSFIILKDNKKSGCTASFLLDIGNINELKIKKDNYVNE
tara:strand:+ start:357 stop:587 length:231 start_codon:yes stop_codon:yes gene_type:complete